MNIELNKDNDIVRKQVWLTAWCAVATADNCSDIDAPQRWADQCLKAFDERFGKLI